MAIVVMYRLAKEKEEEKSILAKSKYFLMYKIMHSLDDNCVCRYWLKQVITLVVVMGITRIAIALFFHVDLIFLTYITTIFIAGQGIIIFILFVPLSKQVMHVLIIMCMILQVIYYSRLLMIYFR